MQIRRSFVLIALVGLVAAACGGSDDGAGDGGADNGGTDTTATTAASGDGGGATETTPATTAPSDDGGDDSPPAVTEMGSFTVNETEFAVTFLNRCIPFGGEDGETIDLQPVAQGQGGQLNLYGTADSLEVSVQGGTVKDLYGSIAFSADPFDSGEIMESSIDGDRWTGSATLEDPLETADPVTVTWDVMIPDEVRDCSL
ncbi:MAG: hypothetical protein ACR2OI_06720 [Acidimicrobiia bacterium]